MDRGKLLQWIASALVVASSFAVSAAQPEVQPQCNGSDISLGTCPPSSSVGGGSAKLEANVTRGKNGQSSRYVPTTKTPDPILDGYGPPRDRFWITNPTITLADIATFPASPLVDHMEPNGWIVTGLPTNFYTTGGAHVVDGTLLGFPAAVRFTPVTWRWSYGDGASLTTSTSGASWAALGTNEFDDTATSHVFTRAGNYSIDLSVDYSAEYNLDGQGWAPIDGVVTVPANRLTATAGDAQTVLVARDCAANPRGPGC